VVTTVGDEDSSYRTKFRLVLSGDWAMVAGNLGGDEIKDGK